MSAMMRAHLSLNTLPDLLKKVGLDTGSQYDFFSDQVKDYGNLPFDLSYIFSRSKNMNMVQKCHNADHDIPQINIAMVFDHDKYKQVFLKSIEGSAMM
ncbi:MAG: hypothetical protein QXV17_11390 [Candidatus Micrarchaeaceae archaeon]